MLGTFRIWAAPRASLGCSSGLDLQSTALGAAQGGPRGAQILNVPRWGVILYQNHISVSMLGYFCSTYRYISREIQYLG